MAINPFDDVPVPTDQQLNKVSVLAEEQVELENALAALEDRKKKLTKRWREVAEEERLDTVGADSDSEYSEQHDPIQRYKDPDLLVRHRDEVD